MHNHIVLRVVTKLLCGLIVLFAFYVQFHGDYSPGGGFQGGAVVASAVLLLLLADRGHQLPHGFMHWMESMAGFAYVMTGMAGLVITGSFLSNRGVLPLGAWNTLFSAGVIPVIYILVGLKVGTELASLLDTLIDTGRPEDSTAGGQS